MMEFMLHWFLLLSALFFVMAYAEIGIDWYRQSNQDIYEKDGVACWPRDLVKRCISTLINAKNKQSAVSSLNNRQRLDGIVEEAGIVPFKGWASKLVDDCFDSFPDIQPIFYSDMGNHFMFKEGNICMTLIEQCLNSRIPLLTLHDSFICPARYASELDGMIKDAFQKEVGAVCIVDNSVDTDNANL